MASILASQILYLYVLTNGFNSYLDRDIFCLHSLSVFWNYAHMVVMLTLHF
jgi:hypothetical protein